MTAPRFRMAGEYFNEPGLSIDLPAWFAHWLWHRGTLVGLRAEAEQDRAVLEAFRALAALVDGYARGHADVTEFDAGQIVEPTSTHDAGLSPEDVAHLAGVGAHAVRRAIREKRLKAGLVGNRYVITRTAAERYAATLRRTG